MHITRTTYYLTFGALLVLLAATVAAAHVPFGAWSATVALSIAAAKTVLIGLYFMHLRVDPPLVRLFSIAGMVWLLLLFAIGMSDYATRKVSRETERPTRERDFRPPQSTACGHPAIRQPLVCQERIGLKGAISN
jgi:cytochrome c oxidase subunit 4